MSAHTVISHALNQGDGVSPHAMAQRASGRLALAPVGAVCGRCPSRGPEGPREAVHTLAGRLLCAFHSPYDVTSGERAELDARTASAPVGVSLGKAGDYANGVVMVPSEGALDRLRSVRGRDVDAVAPWFPIGVERQMDRNDLRALSVAFCVMGAIRP